MAMGIMLVATLVFVLTNSNEKSAEQFISQLVKKCKNPAFDTQKRVQFAKMSKNNSIFQKDKLFYKPLKRGQLSLLFSPILSSKKKVYTEQKLFSKTKSLFVLSQKIENLLHKNTSKFRAVGRQTIIENIAEAYAGEILVCQTFNVFDNFKALSSVFKIYKKEASVLNLLLIKNLICIYVKLSKDVLAIKRQVSKGASKKGIKKSDKPAVIYGAYLFNKNSTKLFLKSHANIRQATSQLLDELDEIYQKQVVIYNYINFLYKGV